MNPIVSPFSKVQREIELSNAPKKADGTPTTMPTMGLGTWQADSTKTRDAVMNAVRDAGYRMVDTASAYGDEHEMGEALQTLLSSGAVKRVEIAGQCKLWNANMRPENVRKDLVASLGDLRVDYVDNFVMHWPQVCPALP